jgi:hypothetical protein
MDLDAPQSYLYNVRYISLELVAKRELVAIKTLVGSELLCINCLHARHLIDQPMQCEYGLRF